MEQLIYSLSEYKFLALIAGFIIIGIESFLPMLPLVAIVIANVMILGMWPGFFVSWMGSSLASIFLYYFAKRCSSSKFFEKYKSKKNIVKLINWIKKQNFTTIFISFACPFIPDFLITISSGFASLDFKHFICGMVSGKFIMFLIISYIGEDLGALFTDTKKLIILVFTVMISWFVGESVNKKIDKDKSK